MLLGKRPRPPVMKRTTSLTEISFDLGGGGGSSSSQQQPGQQSIDGVVSGMLSSSSPPTPRNNKTSLSRRHSADFVETPHFLRTCGLCKRRLVPGRDIYMYRGDTAFCSSECRQQQISQDESKDKCSFASSKKQQQQQQQQHPVSASVASPPIKGETSVPAAAAPSAPVYIQ